VAFSYIPFFSNLLRDLYQYRLKTNFYVKDWSLSEVKEKTGIKYYASTTVNNVHTKDSRDYDHFAFSTEENDNYTLSTAMSLSGAAVSIRMGNIDRGFTSVIMRLFLSLFNINLGGWIRKSETGTKDKVTASKVMSWYNTGLATIFALSIPVIGITRSGVNLGNPGPNTIFILDMIILAGTLGLFLLFLFFHFLIVAEKDFKNVLCGYTKKDWDLLGSLLGSLLEFFKSIGDVFTKIGDEKDCKFIILQIIRVVILILLVPPIVVIFLSLCLIIIIKAIVAIFVFIVGIIIAIVWYFILLVFALIGFVFSNAFVLLKDGNNENCCCQKECFNPLNIFYIFEHCSLFRTIKLILGLRQFDDSPYQFHSDGGHFDNLGLYALLKRDKDIIEDEIFVFDAGEDEDLNLGSLYDVLYFAEKDKLIEPIFGEDTPISKHVDTLSRKIGARTVFERSSSCCIKFDLKVYGKKNNGITKTVSVYYAKATTTGEEPGSLKLHMLNDPVFPYEPTSNQHIGEVKFQAYESLGYHIAGEIFMQLPAALLEAAKKAVKEAEEAEKAAVEAAVEAVEATVKAAKAEIAAAKAAAKEAAAKKAIAEATVKAAAEAEKEAKEAAEEAEKEAKEAAEEAAAAKKAAAKKAAAKKAIAVAAEDVAAKKAAKAAKKAAAATAAATTATAAAAATAAATATAAEVAKAAAEVAKAAAKAAAKAVAAKKEAAEEVAKVAEDVAKEAAATAAEVAKVAKAVAEVAKAVAKVAKAVAAKKEAAEEVAKVEDVAAKAEEVAKKAEEVANNAAKKANNAVTNSQ
jgi:hypothetical protein